MLGKLLKHEFKATYKNYLLMFALLFCMTILARLFLVVKIDTFIYQVFVKLFNVAYVIVMVCISFVSVIMVIARINKNLLKDEGYLSNTLPVKTWQHLVVKGITGTVWYLLTLVVMLASISLYFIGKDSFWEPVKGLFEVISDYCSKGGLHLAVVIFIGIDLLIQVVVYMNSFMAALSLGQLFSKHRIAGAVLFWIILYYAMGMLVILFQAVIRPVLKQTGVLQNMTETQIIFWVSIGAMVYYIVSGLVYFLIANYMMSKKLNLE